jgi:hypothetical protein
MIKVFEVCVSSFIILIIQFISFDEIKFKCFENTKKFTIVTSNIIHTESVESTTFASPSIVVIRFYPFNRLSSTLNGMTSLQRTEKINDTVSETAATTPSNTILTESLVSTISTSTLMIATDL